MTPWRHALSTTTEIAEWIGVNGRRRWCIALLVVFVAVAGPGVGLGHARRNEERLSKIGPAPDFALTTQDGRRLSLSELRGKVVAVTFIYTSCADTCPLLTAKMAGLQARLGPDFGSKVFFVSITLDPASSTLASDSIPTSCCGIWRAF